MLGFSPGTAHSGTSGLCTLAKTQARAAEFGLLAYSNVQWVETLKLPVRKNEPRYGCGVLRNFLRNRESLQS
jgi:hypothetical protein